MTEAGLPSTFVPGPQPRLPHARRRRRVSARYQALVGGMCETDYSGYPDCRDATIKAMQSRSHSGWTSAPDRNTVNVARQGVDVAPRARSGRRRARRYHPEADAYVLPGRAHPTPRMGVRMRRNVPPASSARRGSCNGRRVRPAERERAAGDSSEGRRPAPNADFLQFVAPVAHRVSSGWSFAGRLG